MPCLFPRYCAATLLISMLACLTLSAAPGNAPIRVGFYENPPKIYRGEDQSFRGFFPELIRLIAEAEGWEIQFVPVSWNEGLDKLEKGELDVMPDVALTLERQERFLFGEETALISWAVIYTRPTINIGALFDLEDMVIAVLRGSVYDVGDQSIRNLLEQFNVQATFVSYDTHADVFAAIQYGDADAGVVNNIFGASLESDYRVRRTPIVFSPSPIWSGQK